MNIEQLRKIRVELQSEKMEGPCWEGYEQIGMKIVDGREVPNCVPIKDNQSKEKFVIPAPESGEEEQAYISRCISAIYDEYGQEQSSAICYAKWGEK